jgi:hypothetical protein
MNPRALFTLACIILVTGACSSTNGAVEADADAEVESIEVLPETESWPLCEPGKFNGCSFDFKHAIVCNKGGDQWMEKLCLNDKGGPSRCDEFEGCLACLPLDKRCRSEDEVEICGDDGTQWLLEKTCNGAQTGQVCETGACVALCELSKKWNSYMGCEYWAADLDNGFVAGPSSAILDAAGAQYAVIVSNPNPKLPVAVEIYDSDGPVKFDSDQLRFPEGKILPRDLRVYRLPRRDCNGTLQARLAYRITTSIPATVYQFNPLEDEGVYSNDASLLLPINVLDKWYFVMTREQGFEGIRGFMAVIGTRPDTQVTVTVSAHTLPGGDIPALKPGESITRMLQPFDVLNIETNKIGADLTGSMVVSTRKVAVFGGSEGANVPNSNQCNSDIGVCTYDGETPCQTNLDCSAFITCCADHIEQQLFPVQTWGTHYIGARTLPRGQEPEYWRVLAAEHNTVVSTVPPVANIPVLHSGEWFEFMAEGDFELNATKPVMVGQFMAAEHAPEPGQQPGDAEIGDPAFMLVVPTVQYRKDYVFLAPPAYDQDFINIVSKPGAEVILDGVALSGSQFEPIGTGEYWVIRLPVDDGVHSVVSEEPIGVLSYGFDQYVSYGYPAGLDLKRLDLIKSPDDPFEKTP